VLEHDGLHVIEDVGVSAASEEGESAIHGAQKGAHGLAESELEVQVPGVAERGHERADATRDPRQSEAKVRPVDQQDFTRKIVHREVYFGRWSRPQPSNEVAHDGESTRVALLAQPLQHLGCLQLGCRNEPGLNRLMVRVEQG
jgi:hypothetical protein